MAMSVLRSLFPSLLFHLLVLNFVANQASSKLVLEYGYTVSTVFDGNKLQQNPIHPFSVLPRPGRTEDLLLLDSSSSTFYTVSFPISQDSAIDRFAGNGKRGFSDGDSTAAMFGHPRSFAVDSKGSVYVADYANHAIRKISQSGVTTIAGGYSKSAGRTDGPAQNASFSDAFDLTFLPKQCALLISDRGNSLVRQMILKPGDCAHDSPPGLGMTMVSVIGVLCSLAGLIAGRHVSGCHHLNEIWKHCQTNMRRRVLIIFSDMKSAVASSRPHRLLWTFIKLNLSIVSLIFSACRVKFQRWHMEPITFLDLGPASSPVTANPQISADHLKDLTSSEGGSASFETNKPVERGDEKDDVSKKVE